ncbi:MAG: hypothetical protein MJZ27_03260 [Bacteroidales bacterium]|nr:hypothetical protein [Bacteroidales bacterium]
MKKILYIIVFWILGMTVYAQRMPVSVTTILTPPYTTSLSAMAESGSTRLMVNLLVNDLTVSEMPVKLHIKMESAGITIESLATQAVSPLFVGGGEAMVLTGDDLAQSLRLDNLSFKGLSKSAYLKSGHLPAGLWKFSVSVRHYYTNKTISNVGTVTAWITTYQPPELVYPRENAHEPSNISLPLTFSWQPSKHTGGTDALMYRLELWERRVEGVPAQAVVAAVPPIYTTETAGTTVSIPQAALALEAGMRYCWRVTAYDPAGMVTIENKGESDVRTFQYLDKCPEVCGVTIEQEDIYGRGKWEMDLRHVGGYNVEIYDDGGTYRETLWGGMNYTAKMGGDHGNTWHVRVQGICKNNVESEWSEWADFKVPEAFKPLTDENGKPYECGEFAERRKITNFELRETLAKGDTLENERGTTKYIIHTAVKNEDGTFRGLSYAKLSIWGVKILGEYDHLKVNTDGVMLGAFTWRSVKSDKLVVDPEAMVAWADELALNIAGATYNSSIKDTVKIDHGVTFETIEREGNRYYAVTGVGEREEITSMINGERRVLVKDEKGHELVIDKDGDVMGVEEYKSCGGSSLLLKQYNAEKDSMMATSGNVTFEKIDGEEYGFDKWRENSYDKDQYPTITEHNDYRPAYLGIEKREEVKIKASRTKGLTFKNERGVPLIADKENNTLTFNAGTSDQQAIYAYEDTVVVGKLDVRAYDPKEAKVHLVRIKKDGQDKRVLDQSKIEKGVNEIWQQAVVRYTFDELEPVSISYADGEKFVHGGKGTFQNYNEDQKSAIRALPEGVDENDYYLFFVDCYDRLDTAGMVSREAVSGYMPAGRHYGFIYNQYDNVRTIAHELGHGVNVLHHTFSEDSESFHTTVKTDNLMDYNGGIVLNHKQWQWSHEKHRNVLGFLDDEGESEIKIDKTELITEIIEKLRCCIATKRTMVVMNSPYTYVNAKHSLTNCYAECYFGDTHKRYQTYEIKLPYTKTTYNNTKVKYDFGEFYFLVNEIDDLNFEKYLNNNNFDAQREIISNLIQQGKTSEAIDALYNNSYCVYESLNINERNALITALSEKFIVGENYEDMIINLLRVSLANEYDARKALEYLFKNKSELYETLSHAIDNFNGQANYSEFIKVMVDLYVKAYGADLERGYIQPISVGNISISPNCYFREWQSELKGDDVPLIDGKYNVWCQTYRYIPKVERWLLQTQGRTQLLPSDIIAVHFETDVLGFQAGTTVNMPVFFHAYMLNTKLSEFKVDILDNALYCVAAIKTIKVLQGGIKVLTVADFVQLTDFSLSSVDKIIDMDDMKEYLESKESDSFNYEIFRSKWKVIYESYQAVTTQKSVVNDLLSRDVISSVINGLNLISTYQSDKKDISDNEKEKIKQLIAELQIIMNDENVVY